MASPFRRRCGEHGAGGPSCVVASAARPLDSMPTRYPYSNSMANQAWRMDAAPNSEAQVLRSSVLLCWNLPPYHCPHVELQHASDLHSQGTAPKHALGFDGAVYCVPRSSCCPEAGP